MNSTTLTMTCRTRDSNEILWPLTKCTQSFCKLSTQSLRKLGIYEWLNRQYWCQQLINSVLTLCILPFQHLEKAKQALPTHCQSSFVNIMKYHPSKQFCMPGEISVGNDKTQEENKKSLRFIASQVQWSSKHVPACLLCFPDCRWKKIAGFVKSQ